MLYSPAILANGKITLLSVVKLGGGGCFSFTESLYFWEEVPCLRMKMETLALFMKPCVSCIERQLSIGPKPVGERPQACFS